MKIENEKLRKVIFQLSSYSLFNWSPGIEFEMVIENKHGPKVIKLLSCSAQLRVKFIMLLNVKMPTIVGILTFISRINYRLW